MSRLFVDTSAWYAYLDRDDPHHTDVAAVIEEEDAALVTSTYIFDETVTLVRARLGHELAVRTGDALLDPAIVELAHATPADLQAAWALFRARPDKAYSFTDCTSFAIMERLGVGVALALDDDFTREGFDARP